MSSHIRNAGRGLHKAHLRRRIARIEEEQAMAERTTTDEIIDVAVETARDTFRGIRNWGINLVDSLEKSIDDDKATKRRSQFEVIDGEKPTLYDGERDWREGDTMEYVTTHRTRDALGATLHHPTVTVMHGIRAASLAEARAELEDQMTALGYTIIKHPSVQ